MSWGKSASTRAILTPYIVLIDHDKITQLMSGADQGDFS